MNSAGRSLWVSSLSAPLLAAGEVHLWRFPLEPSPLDLPFLQKLLSVDELHRAARLLDPQKASAFIVGRARLRQILASYLVVDPTQIAFVYGQHGKPALLSPVALLNFNLTHSGVWAVLAVAPGMEIGVDLEKIDPCLDYQCLATRFFTPEETSALAAAPEARRRREFYRLWTCKEARLKGEGGGFSASLGRAPERWTTRSFWLGHGYVGALACNDTIRSFRRFSCGEECLKQGK
jgi:4'-phosphopantetheinyl transferase